MNKAEEITVIAKAIRDWEGSYKGFVLPKPQMAGTSTQQQAYARQQAERFYENHFEEDRIEIPNERFIEAVTELAEKVVHERFGEAALIDDGAGGTLYTDEAQDLFNEVYDETETILNNTLKVFPKL